MSPLNAYTTGLLYASDISYDLPSNERRILESLHERPMFSLGDVQELTGRTYTAANNLVNRLTGFDILHEFTGQARNRRFVTGSYLSLFHESGSNGDGKIHPPNVSRVCGSKMCGCGIIDRSSTNRKGICP